MPQSRLRGIAAMLAAVAFFAVMDALLKALSAHYPVLQVGALRGAASLPFVLLPVVLRNRWRDLVPVRFSLHLLRGVLSLVMLGGFVYALKVLSLADAYAVFFVAPLLVTALSVPILKEHVGWRRGLAILAGLGGVLYMLQPGGSGLGTLGALGAFAAALAYALSVIAGRVLTRTDTNVAMVFWFLFLLAVLAGVLALPGWMPVRQEHWGHLLVLGAVGAIAQHFITVAFRCAPASVIAPFEYTALVWAVAIDWVVWSAVPHARMFVGAAIVIMAGLYLIWRERPGPASPVSEASPPP